MDIRELRIGNYVRIDNPKYWPSLAGVDLAVTSISPTHGLDYDKTHCVGCEHLNMLPNRYYESYSQFAAFIKPIELTEELLLRFGFTKEKNVQFYQKYYLGNFYIYLDKGVFHYNTLDWWVKIKHVHFLQNIFFHLTGHELTWN
jgi:hypothetical protein